MCKIDGQNVHVDINSLFSRLVVLLERCEDVTLFFKFKLTSFPTSIFKNFQMRNTNKAVLKHHLTTDIPESQPPTADTMFVLDRGALLHQVKWLPRVTNSNVVAQ